jgi:hypothetical protein
MTTRKVFCNMKGKRLLYLDQYGNRYFASTVKELRVKVGGGQVRKMYCDKKDGSCVHTGYVVGQYWCSFYQPLELPFQPAR